MKLNNKGFIAISLIYSFFLVFLITLLAVVSDYAHNRVLLNDVKKETQEYLNGLAAFNPVYLKYKKNDRGENINYEPLDEVTFGADIWQVVKDDGENVTLLLKRTLTKEEIETSLSNVGITNASNEDKTLMCLNRYNPAVCNYENSVVFNYYSWNISIVKRIVDDFLFNDANLQKAISVGSMQNMTYSDTIRNYTTYIRIPLSSEFDIIRDNASWYLTLASRTNGMSTIGYGSNLVTAHNTYKNIRPVIMVKKST